MTPSSKHEYAWWQQRLEGQRRTADGFKAICPAHEDNAPSLHVTQKGRTGYPVLHCLAGCTYKDIEAAASGEAQHTPRVTRTRASSKTPDYIVPRRWRGRALDWFADYLTLPRAFLESLPIVDAGDEIHLTFPHNGIAKVRKAGDKKYTWNHPGAFSPPLWPMPEDTLPDTIYLTEGETDCCIARYMGLPAYAITHGAPTGLAPAVWKLLLNRGVSHVVLMFDQDDAGEKAMVTYAEAAIASGLSVSTLRPELYILEGEKDLRDWFRRTQGLEPLVRKDEVVALDLETLEAMSPQQTSWIAYGYFAKNAVTLVSGYPKSGKSSLIAHFIHCHEGGGTFLGVPVTEGRAILLTEEFAPTLLEKAAQFGMFDCAVLTQSDAARHGWAFQDALARAVAQARREKRDVLVIDTLSAWAQFENENDASEVTKAVSLIRNTAAGSGLAVIILHHTKKGGGEHGEAVRGSSALFALADISIEYTHKDKTTRGVEVRSRYSNPPDPLFVRMLPDGTLDVLDQAEWNYEEARPVLEALVDGPKTMAELIEATSLTEVTVRKYLVGLETLGKIEVTVGARNKKTYTLTDNGDDGGAAFKVNIHRVKRPARRQRPSDAGTRPITNLDEHRQKRAR